MDAATQRSNKRTNKTAAQAGRFVVGGCEFFVAAHDTDNVPDKTNKLEAPAGCVHRATHGMYAFSGLEQASQQDTPAQSVGLTKANVGYTHPKENLPWFGRGCFRPLFEQT